MLPTADNNYSRFDDLRITQPIRVSVDVAPALNALNSIATVAEVEESPGISEWSAQTRAKLSDEDYEKLSVISHWIGVDALSNVVDEAIRFEHFGEYIDRLEAFDAVEFRDGLLYWMVKCPHCQLKYKPHREIEDHRGLLNSWDVFWDFFGHEDADDEKKALGRKVFELFSSPVDLKTFIIDFLKFFWDTFLQQEWKRNSARLEEVCKHYSKIDVTGMSHFEIIERITHRNVRGAYRPEGMQQYSIFRFIPSPHSGPYILMSGNFTELRIAFGAFRYTRPAGKPDTSHIVEKMKALADATRLEIVELLREEEELGTAEIIERLDLSKSAASRHLRQLYATGIIDARVDEDGLSKYYRVNPDAVIMLQGELGSLLG